MKVVGEPWRGLKIHRFRMTGSRDTGDRSCRILLVVHRRVEGGWRAVTVGRSRDVYRSSQPLSSWHPDPRPNRPHPRGTHIHSLPHFGPRPIDRFAQQSHCSTTRTSQCLVDFLFMFCKDRCEDAVVDECRALQRPRDARKLPLPATEMRTGPTSVCGSESHMKKADLPSE